MSTPVVPTNSDFPSSSEEINIEADSAINLVATGKAIMGVFAVSSGDQNVLLGTFGGVNNGITVSGPLDIIVVKMNDAFGGADSYE